MSTNIYVLRLQGGRFYVGKSNDVAKRYQEHLAGAGSAWTRKYPPIALEREIPNASPFDEDKITKQLMAKHGIDRVRGGSYVTEILQPFQVQAIMSEIRGATNACSICGTMGHFAATCYRGKARPPVNRYIQSVVHPRGGMVLGGRPTVDVRQARLRSLNRMVSNATGYFMNYSDDDW